MFLPSSSKPIVILPLLFQLCVFTPIILKLMVHLPLLLTSVRWTWIKRIKKIPNLKNKGQMTIVPLILVSLSQTHGASFCSGLGTGSLSAAQKHRRKGRPRLQGVGAERGYVKGVGLPLDRGSRARPWLQAWGGHDACP
jgi:hypothetical protein